MRNAILATSLAAVVALGAAVPVAAHIQTDTKTYIGNCDALLCGLELPCPGEDCRIGGALWNHTELSALHGLGDGPLDVRVRVVDQSGQPVPATVCVAQERSATDQQGNICNDPESEPDVEFCGTSPTLTDAIQAPLDDADFVLVRAYGPIGSARNDIDCGPTSAATGGSVVLQVQE